MKKKLECFCLRMKQKYVSDLRKITFIIIKTTLHLKLVWRIWTIKARHEFQHSVPINHPQRAHTVQMVPRINRKYLSEQFQVTGLRNDDTLSLLWGREDNFQNWTVTIPLPGISRHIDLLNAPTEPAVKSSEFPCLLGIVLVDTSLSTVAAVPAQINWNTKP